MVLAFVVVPNKLNPCLDANILPFPFNSTGSENDTTPIAFAPAKAVITLNSRKRKQIKVHLCIVNVTKVMPFLAFGEIW